MYACEDLHWYNVAARPLHYLRWNLTVLAGSRHKEPAQLQGVLHGLWLWCCEGTKEIEDCSLGVPGTASVNRPGRSRRWWTCGEDPAPQGVESDGKAARVSHTHTHTHTHTDDIFLFRVGIVGVIILRVVGLI